MSPSVLVTGATGKTGRRLVPSLLDVGVTVRAASRRPDASHTRFDWERPETHDAALDGVDAVYLVPPDFVEDPSGVVGPFLDRAREAGVRRVVLLSSLGATFPDEPPDSGRRRLEDGVRESGLGWTMLRPSGFFQNFSEGFLLPGILQAGAVMSATGRGAVSMVDAGDIAAVAAAALIDDEHDGAEYAVTGPEALTFDEAARIVSDVAGRPVAHRAVPSAAFADVLAGSGVPPDYLAMLIRDQEAIRAGYAAAVTGVVHDVTGRPARAFPEYAAHAAEVWTSKAAPVE